MAESFKVKSGEEINLDYPNGTYPIHGEYEDLKSLWRAVVVQALRDMRLKPSNRKNRVARKRAIGWVDLKEQGFLDICLLAEFEPSKVVGVARSSAPLQENKSRL